MIIGLYTRSLQKGVTLVEVLITSVIVLIVGLGLISSLVFMRQTAEYDKQRAVAINYARQFIEQTRRDLVPSLEAPYQTVTLDDFGRPTNETGYLQATASIKLWRVDGSGNRVEELTSPPSAWDLLELEVTIEWNRTGRLSSRRVSESLRTYIVPEAAL